MQVLSFADFARRRADATQAEAILQHSATVPAVVTDRWASLHAEPVEAPASVDQERDFFADLELRMAYPTYAFQHH